MVSLRNVIGLVVGIVAFVAALYVLSFIIGLIISIPFIGRLLSWPSTPILYSTIIVSNGSIFISWYICSKICLPNSHGIKVGLIILPILIGIFYIINIVIQAMLFGWFDELIGWGVAVVLCVLFAKSAITGEDEI